MPKVICSCCGGSGKALCVGDKVCTSCHGTGRNHKQHVMAILCVDCRGLGKIAKWTYVDCKICNGKGRVEY